MHAMVCVQPISAHNNYNKNTKNFTKTNKKINFKCHFHFRSPSETDHLSPGQQTCLYIIIHDCLSVQGQEVTITFSDWLRLIYYNFMSDKWIFFIG